MRSIAFLSAAAALLGAPGSYAFLPSAPSATWRHSVRMTAEKPERHMTVPQKLLGYAAVAFATWQAGFSSIGISPSGLPMVRTEQVAQAAQRQDAPTAAGSRVNKDAESLLRWGLPIDSPVARELQDAVESVKDEIRLKRYSQGKGATQKARSLISGKREVLLKAVRPGATDEANKLMDVIADRLAGVSATFDIDAGRGSEQERAKLDQAYALQTEASQALSRLEELMVPANYKVEVPPEFSNLPQLQGRAVVEMVLKKPNAGEKFDIKGKLLDEVKLRMVIDGYNAPVTGGNFVELVSKGFYNNMPISRSDGFVVQYGDPDPNGDVHGYIPPGQKEVRTIPLEIFVKGDDAPMYGTTTEDDGRGAAAVRLPFQAYGTMGMARTEYEADSASSQVFWLLFESDLTPAGKNFLDGRYTCFGYTVEGADQLIGVKEGDVIQSAKVVDGLQYLKKSA